MKQFLTAAFALALASAAFAQDQASDPVVVSADGVTIRQSDFEQALKSLPPEYQQYAQGPGKRQFAEDFLRMKLLAREGIKAGADRDPEVVAQLALMRENLVANSALKKMEESVKPTEAELKQAYENKKSEYEEASARHILIAFKGSPAHQPGKPELTEEQAKAKAENLREQILKGASFDELAQKESDDVGSGAKGGDLGKFGRGQMVPEFEQVTFTSPIGEVSPAVRTQFGYHLIKVDSRGTSPFEEVRPNLERALQAEKLQAELKKRIEAAKPTYNEQYFGK